VVMIFYDDFDDDDVDDDDLSSFLLHDTPSFFFHTRVYLIHVFSVGCMSYLLDPPHSSGH
jgi:hypothetical protein